MSICASINLISPDPCGRGRRGSQPLQQVAQFDEEVQKPVAEDSGENPEGQAKRDYDYKGIGCPKLNELAEKRQERADYGSNYRVGDSSPPVDGVFDFCHFALLG